MKHVLRRIMARKKTFSEQAIFNCLRDATIPPRVRLGFIPAMAHFIMSFKDLNQLVLRFVNPQSELERAVNAHTLEDETHWVWYLEDLTSLGFDREVATTATIRELWSEETAAARNLTYRLVSLLAATNAAERLALIEVMEETGNVMFCVLVPIARALESSEGVRLRFCGDTHLDRETGHTIGADHRLLMELALDAEARVRILGLVDSAFDAFDDFAQELYRRQQQQLGADSARLTGS